MEKFSTDLDSQRFGNSCLEKFSTIWILNDSQRFGKILFGNSCLVNSQRFGEILNDLEKSCLEILVW